MDCAALEERSMAVPVEDKSANGSNETPDESGERTIKRTWSSTVPYSGHCAGEPAGIFWEYGEVDRPDRPVRVRLADRHLAQSEDARLYRSAQFLSPVRASEKLNGPR